MIITVAITLVGAAWSQRPIIEYTLSDYPDTFDLRLNSRMGVWLKIKNTGVTYAMLNLVVTVKNANIIMDSIEQGMTYNGTQLKIHYDLSSGMETYDEHYIEIEPIDNPENFTVDLKIENLADWSIPKGLIGKFLEPHDYVNHIAYKGTDTATYELIP